MSKNFSPLKAVVIVACSLIGAFTLLVIAVMVINPQPSEETLQKRKERRERDSLKALTKNLPDTMVNEAPTPKQEKYTLTEDDYIKYFQAEWDSVKLVKDDFSGFPKYGKYTDDLSEINRQMSAVVESNPNFSKLEKLRMKFVDSKKWAEADKKWLTYGEPGDREYLISPCRDYIVNNAHDPYSIDIVDSGTGQTNKGWKVQVRYRGKNMLGNKVINVATFDVRFNPVNKSYYVNSVQ